MWVCDNCGGEYETEQQAVDCAEYDKEEDYQQNSED